MEMSGEQRLSRMMESARADTVLRIAPKYLNCRVNERACGEEVTPYVFVDGAREAVGEFRRAVGETQCCAFGASQGGGIRCTGFSREFSEARGFVSGGIQRLATQSSKLSDDCAHLRALGVMLESQRCGFLQAAKCHREDKAGCATRASLCGRRSEDIEIGLNGERCGVEAESRIGRGRISHFSVVRVVCLPCGQQELCQRHWP